MLSLNKYMFQGQHLTTMNTSLHFLLLPLSFVRAVILIWFSVKIIELRLYRMGDAPCNVCFMLCVLLIKNLEWSHWLQPYSNMAGHQPRPSVKVKPLVGLIALFMFYIDLPATHICFCWLFLASVFYTDVFKWSSTLQQIQNCWFFVIVPTMKSVCFVSAERWN